MTENEYKGIQVGDTIITTSNCIHIVRKKHKDMIGVDAEEGTEEKMLTEDGLIPIAIYACTKVNHF